MAQYKHNNQRKVLVMRTLAMTLFMALFTQFAQAQSEILKMTNGRWQVPDEGFLFYDSGGPLLYDPETNPTNANDYNWTTWYQHNEDYTLTLENDNPGGGGIEIEFEKILINNDLLKFYEGNTVDEEKLIGAFTNNDYSSAICSSSNKVKVVSHGNMTIRFVSDYHWRDEGWVAKVFKTSTFTPQPPVAMLAACSNMMSLFPTSTGENVQLEYKINTGAWQAYALGELVNLTGQNFDNLTVTTRATVDGVTSAEKTYTFKEIKEPDIPDYEHDTTANTVTLFFPDKPNGVNDTYYIRWTINNNSVSANENPRVWEQQGHEFQQPSNTPNSEPAGVINYTNVGLATPFYIHFATRGTTCSDIFSDVVTVKVKQLYVPKPTITFVTNAENNGATTMACSLSGVTIYYTTDGSEPDPDHVGAPYPTRQYMGGSVIVPAGTTVKAVAVKTGFVNSDVASEIFIPGAESGNGQNGVYESIVLLDDREDHKWSYYSDGDQPIHSLKPMDIKITYKGFGTNTMTTTSTADTNIPNSAFDGNVSEGQVKVNYNEAGNQFVYLKTLENSNPEGGGTYPYTIIPNPFQVRPALAGTVPTTRTIVIVTSRSSNQNSGWEANPKATLTVTCNGTTLTTIDSRTTTTITDVPVGQQVTLTFTNGGNNNNRCRITVYYDAANTTPTVFDEYNPTSNGMGTRTFIVAAPAAQKDYRGFYAWRVKSMSTGLSIKVGSTTYTSADINNGIIIFAEQEVEFITTKAYGNEVEFEALWAKAYVKTSSDNANGLSSSSYERNFIVGANAAALNVPVTYSSYYPDGTFRQDCSVNGFTCSNDTKFENMTISGGTFTAANHYLCMGRGLSGTANLLQGINNGTTTLDYTLRVESGTYTQLAFVRASGCTVSGRYLVKAIMGCDYDRANNKDNSKLSVSNSANLFFSTGVTFNSNTNQNAKTFDLVVKSGEYQKSYWYNQNTGATNNSNDPVAGGWQSSFYCGQNQGSGNYPGLRYVTIEGGEFGCMAGGRGTNTSGNIPTGDLRTITIRIKGGLFHGAVYGGAADSNTYGNRAIIVTGGEIQSWIAGANNGTGTSGDNATMTGDTYVYVGGDALVGGDNANAVNRTNGGQVFGAGRGNSGQNASATHSYVVIADDAQILNNNNTAPSGNFFAEGGNVYGGGNYGYITNVSNVYILGGTIQKHVFGGAYGNSTVIPTSNVYVKGGTVNGSVYGGSNSSGTVNNTNVIMTGGTVPNVFGGGFGASTIIADSTIVHVGGGTINNNVYGGGEQGEIHGNTHVNISGGTMKNVYGAGKGDDTHSAEISGQTFVNVSGGTMNNVFGGGEEGTVVYNGDASTVTIQGGTVNEDVFGGGRMGKTTGNVIVNVYDGIVTGNVYGGAFGTRGSVYIAGTHSVNITGGNIYTNVYGGSRNADDALNFNHTGYGMSQAVNHVNISGGHVYYQVFAGGYFGHTYGSVYAFVGQNAINNAPNANPTDGVSYNAAALLIDGSVWAGADFGNFDGYEFGDATIEGYSNVYIDGTGYNTISTKPTDAGYMNIGGSVLGAGTSCYAGELGRDLIFRNYGQPVENPNSKEAVIEPYTTATRNLMSIQFFNYINIDNTHLQLIGQGRINSLVNTEKYSVYEIKETMRMINGSSFFIDFPMDQVKKLGSYACADVYAASPSYTVVDYSNLPTTSNKFRVNNGAYLNIKYIGAYNPNPDDSGWDYGELEGFFYMMTDDENHTCAYARPKQSTEPGNTIPDEYDNEFDGGFLSYHTEKNIYDVNGSTEGTGVQMPYENHTLGTRNGELYFRIWRYGGLLSYRQGVFNAIASTTPGYSTADVLISLPAQHGVGSYFKIKTENGFPLIDYGDDVMTVNAGAYDTITANTPATNGWMYYSDNDSTFIGGQTAASLSTTLTPLTTNPNVNFGLVAIPQGSLVDSNNLNWLICNEAGDEGEALATERWTNMDNLTNPSILFRLTYNNALTNNATWDPIIITFQQYDVNDNLTDEIQVALSVSTVTTINQNFSTQAIALMDGHGGVNDIFTAKVVLPGFVPFVDSLGTMSNWSFVEAEWHGETGFSDAWTSGSNYVNQNPPYANNKFSMQMVPSSNFDNSIGWNTYNHTVYDVYTIDSLTHLAATDGRNPTAFDFIMHYDGRATCDDTEPKKKLGELVVTLHFTNLATSSAPDHGRDLTITIEVFRRGKGNNYFLDGVNGNNFFAGDCPDAAKKTLSGIFNRTEYTYGDNIFIVNTVTADGATALDWNGEQYGQVTLYRYPGGHGLKKTDPMAQAGTDYYAAYSDTIRDPNTHEVITLPYNPYNKGFAGTLVKVQRGMNMHSIVLDGAYDIAYGHPNTALAPTPETYYQVPTAPLIKIESNGTLTMYANSKLQWNYTNSDGGAVYNAGKMIIRNGSDINHNRLLSDAYNGGGVFVKAGAQLIVSDSITIDANSRIVNSVAQNSNVYLESVRSVIQVGTVNPSDGIGALANHLSDGTGLKSAKIGVTKGDWGEDYFTPIAYSDGGGNTYLGNIIPANPDDAAANDYIIYDDDLYYKLVTLNNTPGYEPSIDYLFWVGTWVTKVHEKPDTYTEVANGGTADIHNAYDLAWAISVVNGLNGHEAHPKTNFNVTADIDMSANIWVPMGTGSHPYTGTFNANGHVIKGVKSPLNEANMGMFGTFGSSRSGNIQNMILSVNFTGGNSVNMGSVAAVMNGGTINNVETAGVITGTSSTLNMGGIVGNKTNGALHSSFAVNTITATNSETNVGGLVGNNTNNLYNSYANTTLGETGHIGGLAGVNKGVIENCYAVLGSRPSYPAFAYQNDGTIKFCYADRDNGYVDGEDSHNPTGHGLYGVVLDRKDIGYMYFDNIVTLAENAGSTHFVIDTIKYNDAGTQIEKWSGLLSSLNQWVNQDANHKKTYTPWFRPTSANINGDLPVLAFPADNSMGTTDADGKYLIYGSIDHANGLDTLLYVFNEKMEDAASSLFLYGSATDVTRVPESQVKVFINEHASLLQAAGSDNFINTTVGITFDNSWGKAHAFPGGNDAPQLKYDWHMMSTPLRDAKIGATYTHAEGDTYTPDAGDNVVWQRSPVDIGSLTDSYFPNGLVGQDTVSWDFYSFYEPEYHWVNLKRNKNNHFHQDAWENVIQEGVPYQVDVLGANYKHYQFEYDQLDQSATKSGDASCVFIPGKGYMMAISMDSYMSSTGTLNNGNVNITIPLTMQSSQQDELGCNLLGNPYQAYLDMSKFFANSMNSSYMGNSYWVYIAEDGNYVAGNCTASTNYALPSVTLHPHQAFFVKTNTDNVNAVFDYYNMAVADSAGFSYFRGDKIDYPLVNLFACNEQGSKDLTVIEMNRPMLDGSPKMRTLNNANFELYARTNGQDYSILFTEEGTERVAVGFKAKEDGTYTLKWDSQNGKFSYLQLIDNITGAERDMLTTDHYSFEAHATDLATRFYVVFKVDKGGDDISDNPFAFFNGNDWVVNGKGTLQLIDVMGRILYSEYLPDETSRVHFDNFTDGVYMLRLVDGNNTLQVQKIVIQ